MVEKQYVNDRELADLMARIDERTLNIWRSVEKLEKHQGEQNGFTRETMIKASSNRTFIRTIISVGGIIATTIICWLARLQGMW